MKHPIFIGSAERDLINNINRMLFEGMIVTGARIPPCLDNNVYELCVMSDETYKQLHDLYYLQTLDKKDKEIIQNEIQNKQLKDQAESIYNTITQTLVMNAKSEWWKGDIELMEFTKSQLRSNLRKCGLNVSSNYINATLKLLIVHGFVMAKPGQVDKESHKIKYIFITSSERYIEICKQNIESLNDNIKLIKSEINYWKKQIENGERSIGEN